MIIPIVVAFVVDVGVVVVVAVIIIVVIISVAIAVLDIVVVVVVQMSDHCCWCCTSVKIILLCSLLNSLDLDENTKAVLVENIQRKLTQQAVKIRADFECSCFTYEGIDAVKEALRAGTQHTLITLLELWNNLTSCCSGIAAGNPEIPIRINLIAPPVYVMTCSTPDKADGLAVLTDGCKVENF